VFVALGILYAKRMRRVVVCGLLGSTMLFNIVLQMARFSEKEFIENK
jgi:hypothetical protein